MLTDTAVLAIESVVSFLADVPILPGAQQVVDQHVDPLDENVFVLLLVSEEIDGRGIGPEEGRVNGGDELFHASPFWPWDA